MPSFPIVDSHVHLYDPAHLRYSWLSNVPKINRRYDLADFDRCRDSVEVDKIVFAEVWVDPGLHLEEAAWVQELADNDPRLAGMVAHAPLEKGPAVEADLEKLKRFRITRGIRRLIEIEMRPAHLPGARLPRRLKPPAEARPHLRHLRQALAARLRHRAGAALPRRQLRPRPHRQARHQARPVGAVEDPDPRAAGVPNIVVKVSGVVTEADHQRWTKDQVKPYVDHVIDCFGFDRCMYGSDWTVSELTHQYPDWVAILDEVTAGASEAEKRSFWRETAIRTYRLG